MRQVLLDGSLLEALQTRLFTAKTPFETGLIIGRLILDHAAIVSGMLVGGITVIGIYAFCPSDAAKSKESVVHTILRKLYRKQAAANPLGLEDWEDERLFLQLCSKTKRNTVKAFSCKDTSKGSHPGELKLTPNVASGLVKITSHYGFNLSLEHDREEGGEPVGEAGLRLAVEAALQKVGDAAAVMGGALVGAEPLVAGPESSGGKKGKGGGGKGASGTVGGAEERELVLYSSRGVGEEVGGQRVSGSVAAVAYVGSGESTKAAADAVKRDIAQTVSARLGILLDECEGPNQCPSAIMDGGVGEWGLPRRVLFPLVEGVVGGVLVPAGGSVDEVEAETSSMLPGVKVCLERQGGEGEAKVVSKGGTGKAKAAAPMPKPAQEQKAAGGGGGTGKKESDSAKAPASKNGGGGGGGAWKGYVVAAAVLGLAYAAECVLDLVPFI